MPQKSVPPAERFWPKVDKSAGVDGCWIWQGTKEPTGYGQFWWNNTSRKAHRFAWVLTYGEPPDGHHVVQECRNRLCVNPAHLGLKSPAQKQAELAAGKLQRTLAERFWEKVEKRDGDGCWIWIGALDGHGYGQIYLDGAKVSAPRLAWEMANGSVPEGLCVCHNCPGGDNPLCIRPSHMFLDTHRGNLQDAARKGRFPTGSQHWMQRTPEKIPRGDQHYARRNPEKVRRGEQSPHANLTEDQVRDARQRYAVGGVTIQCLADERQVSYGCMHAALTRKTWKHVV